MTIIIYDRYGTEYEIQCAEWKHEKDRFVFYDDRQIIAVFQIDAIVGFIIK